MLIEFTNTFSVDFDLDQAEEDFKCFRRWASDEDLDTTIYAAVESNLTCDLNIKEYCDISPAIEQCARALRERLGGVQMRMEDLPIL